MVSCVNHPLSPHYNNRMFYAQNQYKSVVVMKIYQPYKNLFKKREELKPEFDLVKLDDNYNNQDKKIFYKVNSVTEKILMINPGIYFIENIRWNDGLYGYKSTTPGISKNNLIVYGAFEAKPGIVGYIGNLLMVTIDDRILLMHLEDFINKSKNNKANILDIAKKYLIEIKQENLIEKIQSIEFYNAGSKVHKDNNGMFIITKK